MFGLNGHAETPIDGGLDARIDAEPCAPGAMHWLTAGHPELGNDLSDPTLVESGLELFASRSGVLVHASRSSLTEPFSVPEPITFLGRVGNFMDVDPALTEDGNILVFSSRTSDGVYESTRMGSVWSTPILVLARSPDAGLDLSPDGTILYFSAGTLSRFTRGNTGAGFISPIDLGIDVEFPTLTEDGKRIYYNEVGDGTIHTATRGNGLQPFPAGRVVMFDDAPLIAMDLDASVDGKRLVMNAPISLEGSDTVIAIMTRVCD